jgi:O-antigen/teichoic acid export membrane protein
LLADSTWVLAGNLAASAFQWAILIVLARLGSTALVGEFGLGLGIALPVLMFTSLGLESALATDMRREFPLGRYLRLRSMTALGGTIIIIGVSLVFAPARTVALGWILIGLARAVDAVAEICYAALQRRERFRPVSIGRTLRGLAGVVLVALVSARGASIAAVGLALVGATVAVFLFYDLARLREIEPMAAGETPAPRPCLAEAGPGGFAHSRPCRAEAGPAGFAREGGLHDSTTAQHCF